LTSSGYRALVALGITSLISLVLTKPLLAPDHDAIYHLSGPASSVFLPVFLDFFLAWTIVFGLLAIAQRSTRLSIPIWTAIFLTLPYMLLQNFLSLKEKPLPQWMVLFLALAPCLTIAGIAAFFGRPRALNLFHWLQHFTTSVFCFASLFGVLVLAKLLWNGWSARHLNDSPHLHQPAPMATKQAPPRVIWILLDELSFAQTYGHRFSGLQLPAFDSLAAESTVFTNVAPVGTLTQMVVPSLLTGIPVDGRRVSLEGQLDTLHNPATGIWQPFHPNQTVFQDALDRGYSTGVAGWYNPYCRILPQVLDHCFWIDDSFSVGTLLSGQSGLQNFLEAFWQTPYMVRHALSPTAGTPPSSDAVQLHALLHIDDYEKLRSAGDALLSDSSCTFLFLHMPVPHPEGIYDRNRHAFATAGGFSYLDNLALADRYIAHVRQVLEQRGEWNSSTLIVIGDHSWRTFMWSSNANWTREDELASRGRYFDDRPAYIVKLPNQQNSATIDTRFAATNTRAMLDALLDHSLRASADLQTWVAAHNH
jgi:hypothetical protein